MSNSNNKNRDDHDCTQKCRFRPHGKQITAALTKRSIPDEKLAAFIAKTCANFFDIVDDLGRSAVHLAASVERYHVLEWLLNQGAIINGRDFESGYSPLHRAIHYGCIDAAVLLLRYGASLELLDDDGRSALQNVCRLCDNSTSCNETFVWGSNKNYNLGIGNEEGAQAPQPLDYFRKERILVETLALGAYHSLFLDRKKQLYAVGHGKGGRLGIGNENSLPAPRRVKLPIKNADEHIICVSTSRSHSLLLSNRSAVYACGLNADLQLGVRDAGERLLVFKQVVTLRDLQVKDLLRVIARDQHSLAYSESCIYVWGTNHGQLGMEAGVKTVPLPKMMKLPPRTTINFVEANNSATVVYTTSNGILLYYNNKMRSINPPNFEPLKSISVVGGDSAKSSKGSVTALKLLMLTQTNVVFLWYEMTQHFYRCIFSPLRIAQIDRIIYKSNQVLILSQGDVYRGKCHQVPVPPVFAAAASSPKHPIDPSSIWSGDNNRTEISKEHMLRIELTRLASIDRAVDIFSNDDFSSFAVLQETAWKYFKPPNLMPEEYSFKKLLHEANECDAVHDVVLHVDGETFAAHKFLLYSRAPGLRSLISAFVDHKQVYLNFEQLTAKMFELVLKYIYLNYLPNSNDLDDMQQSLGHSGPDDPAAVCAIFLAFVEDKFEMHDLASYLNSYLDMGHSYPILPHQPDKTLFRFQRLRRTDAHAPYDVRIVCADGVELGAHKCILVDRLEYFNMMFTHSWSEQTTINLETVSIEYMQPIVEFLYSSDVIHFRKQNYAEAYLYNMIVFCDQFFIERLRNACEKLLLDKITIRKCGDMLDFACLYNCVALKEGCVDFICQNLARVLTYKCLDQCEPEALRCINVHYRKLFKETFDYRMITPDSEAIEDEFLLSFVDGFEVDLSYRMNEEEDFHKTGGVKSKTTENKCKQATRHYEREAISSMMDALNLDDSQKSAKPEQSENIKQTKETAERLQAEAKNWMKVVDKKEQKKKLTLEHVLKSNEPPKTDENVALAQTPESTFKNAKTPERETPSWSSQMTDDDTPTALSPKVYNLNLADFTSPREKLSQKQRKQLTTWRAPAAATPLVEETKPVAVPQNAWGVLPQSSPTSVLLMSPPSTGSAGDPGSFANMMRSQAAVTASSPPSLNSFSHILAEERKQREHYERMRTKSLALTQIEETAIAELREFYNADNVSDEIITIERKKLPATASAMNFATWQRN